MSRWEDEFLVEQPAEVVRLPELVEPPKPVEPEPERSPIFVSHGAMVTKQLGVLHRGAVEKRKAVFVKLPCFTC